MQKPNDGECVWVEYPEGRRFRAVYSAHTDCFECVDDDSVIAAGDVAQWSREEHDDVDISDDPKEALKGKLTRD